MDMRRLIGIVEGKSLLTEGQDYEAMFSPILKLLELFPEDLESQSFRGGKFREEITSAIRNWITFAKRAFRKNDRIVWFLRYARISLAEKIERTTYSTYGLYIDNPDVAKKCKAAAEAVYDRLQDDLEAKTGSRLFPKINPLSRDLVHFISLPIPAIQNIVWDRQNSEQLLAEFQRLEDEWKARQSELIPYDPQDGQVVMEFEDGMAWVLLPRGYCEDEATAMGHCGNAGSRPGERILSLRRKIKDHFGRDRWRPSLTFILDRNGVLGEMKGRANSKPDPKYHSHIFALLMDRELIKGIKGGGYKPEANFAISDLTPEEQERLFTERPELQFDFGLDHSYEDDLFD
jgi:hypothetical protein